MASSRYTRVNRRRVCLICGKPDWCSYLSDESISFCARVSMGADRISRTGWGVYYRDPPGVSESEMSKTEFTKFPRLPFPPGRRKRVSLGRSTDSALRHSPGTALGNALSNTLGPAIAPIAIRDLAYRTLLDLAPARFSSEIVHGPKGLHARRIPDIGNYGSLPATAAARDEIAAIIAAEIRVRFPAYAYDRPNAVERIPGFWTGQDGTPRLWLDRDCLFPIMVIPFRDRGGLIQACQLRYMCSESSMRSRYFWMSTPTLKGGSGCGTPLHHSVVDPVSNERPVLLIEGALKADTVRSYVQGVDIVANAGVTCSHEQIIYIARHRQLFIGFDRDKTSNRHVARSVARLLSLRRSDGQKYGYHDRDKIVIWDNSVKGIDEAYIRKMPIYTTTPAQWFESLDAVCRSEVEMVFQDGQ